MFFPLSFKKFKRRVRSPFTLFKKLAKKRNNKQNKPKLEGTEQQSISPAVPADIQYPSTATTNGSLDPDICFPFQVPAPVSSTSGPAGVRVVEHEQHQLVHDNHLDGNAIVETVETQALVTTEPVIKELVDDVSTEEAKGDLVHVDDIKPVMDRKGASQHDVSPEVEETVSEGPAFADTLHPHADETANQDIQSTSQVQVEFEEKQVVQPSSTESALQEHQFVESVAEDISKQDAQFTSPVRVDQVDVETNQVVELSAIDDATQVPQPVGSAAEDKAEQDTQLTSHIRSDEGEVEAKQAVEPSVIDDAVQVSQSAGGVENTVEQAPQLVPHLRANEVEAKAEQVAEPSVTDDTVQEPQVAVNVAEGTVQQLFIQTSPSQTSLARRKMLTPPTTPRKRVTSDMQNNKDADIMAELQASVRSREKKRIERERAEKERKQRELDLIAKNLKEVTEYGNWQVADSEEKNHVLRDVRSWRKQREASLKVNPEDDTKDASYRAAFSNEEIMAELRNAAQSRSLRAPSMENLQEKRQLALEDLFATRLQAIQV